MQQALESTLAPNYLRQQFLPVLFRQAASLEYAYLKYMYDSLAELPPETDIDLLVRRSEIETWEQLLRSAPGLRTYSVRHTSFAAYCSLFFEDGSFLSIDLIVQCKRKAHVFLETEEVLQATVKNTQGIRVASPEHSIEYVLLFYSLNGAAIPSKYMDYLRKQNKVIQSAVRRYIQQKYGLDLWKLAEMRPELIQDRIRQTTRKIVKNQGISGIKLRWAYFLDQFCQAAPTITLSGVDGAGKSTILAHLQEMLENKYRRKVVSLRQRPSILPILSSFKYGKAEAEAKAAATLPRQGTNQSKFSSLLRFSWYYLDYLLGQWIVRLKVNHRSRILLYDRYYFDYIADSRRANIALSPKLIRWLYRGVLKPELNIVLVASPDIILARKQELSREDIVQLTTAYTDLFQSLDDKDSDSRYLILQNHDLSTTLAQIEAAVVDILS
ncbi:MAG: hypothetical protein AAF399_10390 [Bacteroidota bacterium]